jgi:hypothetical protein
VERGETWLRAGNSTLRSSRMTSRRPKLPRCRGGICRWCQKPIETGGRQDRCWHDGRKGEPDCVEAANMAFRPRIYVWRRDHGRCAECGKVCGHPRLPNQPREQWHADHIVPLVDGGANTLDNLQTLCQTCHKKKTRRESRTRSAHRIATRRKS